MIIRLFTDGASRGNPGPAGAGIVIEDEQGMKLQARHRWLGHMTNNEAEYHALIDGLKAAAPWNPERLEVYMDSNLVVQQLNGEFRVKNPNLQLLFKQAIDLLQCFPNRTVRHVEREKNRRADYLANQAIDEHGRG